MLVCDVFKVMSESQLVNIYSLRNSVFVFTGVCSDIPSSCLDIPVSQIVPVSKTLDILVE